MRYAGVLFILLLFAPLSETAQKEKKSKAPPSQTLTGCVDEKGSDYFLSTDDSLKEIAVLESVGFEKANFARFVGHKVSITGQLVTSSDPPTLRVSNYANIKII